MDKPIISYAQLVWQDLAIQHLREGCTVCWVKGCISELRYDDFWHDMDPERLKAWDRMTFRYVTGRLEL